jgi:methylated-DNA-[protein]-cysteine S-methyltransferase
VSSEQRTWSIYESPIGPLTLIAGASGITNLYFPGRSPRLSQAGRRPVPETMEQLREYFAGHRRAFELGLDIRGTPLQEQVWEQLRQIPYGATTTYGQMARQIGESLYDPDLEPYMRVRVVGAAIASNPVPILIACHRVIGADGSLTGYLGGLPRKRALLDLERRGAGARSASRWQDRQLAMLTT